MQTKSMTVEVLDQFRLRKISASKGAELLNISHADFTRLASRHGIPTSTCYTPQPEWMEKIFGSNPQMDVINAARHVTEELRKIEFEEGCWLPLRDAGNKLREALSILNEDALGPN